MATEEQTSYDTTQTIGYISSFGVGQKVTVSSRTISKLGGWLSKKGTGGAGTVSFRIYRWSDKSLLASKDWGLASTLGSVAYKEVTFDSPVTLNEAVVIIAWCEGEDANNAAYTHYKHSDVKADEYMIHYAQAWVEYSDYDGAYIYTYEASTAPTVTTQAVSAIAATTATGNGNVTAVGAPAATQHGVCWNTAGTPDTDDDKTTEGAPSTGAFTSSITGLTKGTIYYVRAYITNALTTAYGAEVSFRAGYETFPADDVARVSSIRHICQPGFFRMQVGLGDLGFDVDIAEASVRKALDTAKEVVEAPPWEVFPEPGAPLPTEPPVTPPTPAPPWEVFPEPGAPLPEEPARPPPIYGGGIVGGLGSLPGLEEYRARKLAEEKAARVVEARRALRRRIMEEEAARRAREEMLERLRGGEGPLMGGAP